MSYVTINLLLIRFRECYIPWYFNFITDNSLKQTGSRNFRVSLLSFEKLFFAWRISFLLRNVEEYFDAIFVRQKGKGQGDCVRDEGLSPNVLHLCINFMPKLKSNRIKQ